MRLVIITLTISLALATHAAAQVSGTAAVAFPLEGPVSSSYGYRIHPLAGDLRMHSGVDIPAAEGTRIKAIAKGTVIFSGNYSGYGQLVVIHHTNGITSHYGHCASLLASPGQRVAAGEVIATVGSTGLTTGPHLHFELRKNGRPGDPASYLPGLLSSPKG